MARQAILTREVMAGIPALVEATLDAAAKEGMVNEPQSIEDALDIDHNARGIAVHLLPEIAVMAS